MRLYFNYIICAILSLAFSMSALGQKGYSLKRIGSRTAGDISLVTANYPAMALINGVYHNDGYYSTRAENQITPIALSGKIINNGLANQTNIRFFGQANDQAGNVVYSKADSIAELLIGVDTLLTIQEYFMPNGIGDFTVSMWCDQAEGDTFPADNYADDVIVNINNNHVIARHNDYNDKFDPSVFGMADGSFVGINFYVAQYDEVSTVSVFIDSLSPSGALLIAYLYQDDAGTLIYKAMSDAYVIQQSDVGNWVHLELLTIDPTDDDLENETRYLAGIEMYSNAAGLILGSDSQGMHDYDIEITASSLGIPIAIEQIPMIEIHLDGYVQNLLESEELTTVLFPNPSSSSINIECDITMEKVELFDISGKKVHQLGITSGSLNVNVSSLPKGTYFVKLSGKDEIVFDRFIKI
jgi:hypothetical protein